MIKNPFRVRLRRPHLRVVLLAALCLVLSAPVWAQVESINDINPDFSNLPDAGGASGGRVNGLVIDPSFPMRMYAASEWGGIYRSQNGGLTWHRLDGHRPVATWDVDVKPNQTAIVVATSFYDGKSAGISQSGINISVNNGVDWGRQANGPPGGFCAEAADQTELSAFGIAFDPADPDNVYVGTSCGLAINNNISGGAAGAWTYKSPPIGGATRIWDVLVSPNGMIIDTCGDAGHWYLDLNSGPNAWTQGSGLLSGRCSLASSPYDPQNLFAAVGFSIFETEDRDNWAQTRINPRPQGRIPFVVTNKRSFAPLNRAFDLWFGDFSVWRVACDSDASPSCGSQNEPQWQGGFTRAAGAHDDTGDMVFDPTASNDACPVALSSDGGVYLSTVTSVPECHFPDAWVEPDVTPHGLWPQGMSGAKRSGPDEDLYFSNQDNGVFGTLHAADDPPDWDNGFPNRSSDSVANDDSGGSIVYSSCCFSGGQRTRVYNQGAGFVGGGEISNYPPGVAPEKKYPDFIDQWGDGNYVMVTHDFGSGFPPDGGVYVTKNIKAGVIAWVPIQTSPTEPLTRLICGVKAATKAGVPTFYVQTGTCNADSSTDRLWKYTGENPGGTWTELLLPQGGFGVFDVNRNDPDQLIAFGFTATDAFAFESTDGGSSWGPLPALKIIMTDGGNFPMMNTHGPTDFTGFDGYLQPSLVAIDPNDPRIMAAGGRDSGVFFSFDAGASWTRVTDPLNSHTSGTPHIPRPRFAYFDDEPGAKSIYIGSQGRGVWRFNLESNCPPNVTLSNQSLTGTENIGAANTLTTGPALVVEAGANPFLEAGQSVIMTNGTSVLGDLTVNAGDFCPAPTQVRPEWRGAGGRH